MNSKQIAAAAVALSTMVVSSAANAEDKDHDSKQLAPATHAVELTIGTGYAQGFGNIASGQPTLTDVGQAGGAVQAGVGYRLIPQLTLGVYGSYGLFSRGDQVDHSATLSTATAGVQADWHFLPSGSEIDPWISLGTGWRGYWVAADQGTSALHGLEIAKLQVGADYRIAPSVAVGPVVGADVSMFLTQEAANANGYSSITSPNVNTFVFAGLQGRFDIPTGSSASKDVASR
jgi:hypothetical protein